MKTIGLSKMGMNSTGFYRILLNSVIKDETLLIENVDFSKDYDFILLDGGSDVSPSFYREDLHPYTFRNLFRDEYERNIFNRYKNTPTKFAGICRGLQFLNVMYGGTLYQSLWDEKLEHNVSHLIEIDDSIIKFLPKRTVVNSLHHQAIKELGKGLFPLAIEIHTKIIEMIGEVNDKVRAVQFHPEFVNGFPYTREILKWLFWYL